MNSYFFTIHGERVRARALMVDGELWLHLDGRTWVLKEEVTQVATGSHSMGAANVDSTGELLAPMPGKILKVNARAREKVSSGQSLIVMEAMKMEYTISAPFDGEVKELLCREGQQVELNQKLIVVEEAGARR